MLVGTDVTINFLSLKSASTKFELVIVEKLSSDHIPGSNTKSPDAASPQPTKVVVLVIVAPAPWAAFVVPPTSLVTPVSSPVAAIPV